VIWFQARTEVDQVNRLVTLDRVKITDFKFPVAHEKESVLRSLLEEKLPAATRRFL
jgi:hypothetical protein